MWRPIPKPCPFSRRVFGRKSQYDAFEKSMICPNCEHDNPEESGFCLNCGARIGHYCSYCGHFLPLTANFCNRCGRTQRPSAAGGQVTERGNEGQSREAAAGHAARCARGCTGSSRRPPGCCAKGCHGHNCTHIGVACGCKGVYAGVLLQPFFSKPLAQGCSLSVSGRVG